MRNSDIDFVDRQKFNLFPKTFFFKRLLLLLFCYSAYFVVEQYQDQRPNHVFDLSVPVSKSFCVQLSSKRIPSDEIPKESLNPRSQYFGLVYKNTYGKSVSPGIGRKTFYENYTRGFPNWTSFFPNLAISLKKRAEYNWHNDPNKFTSKQSFFTVSKPVAEYKVGESFEAKIQAVDFDGKSKTYGGDQFSARLVAISPTAKRFPDGIPCNIEDHLNGSYTISAPLPVAGKFFIEVILCASVDAVASYVDWTAGRIHQGLTFSALLETNEIVLCNMDLLLYDAYKNKTVCNYSNLRNGEPYFCEKPSSGNCSPITRINFRGYRNYFASNFRKPFDIIFRLTSLFKIYQSITGSTSTIQVFSERNESNEDVLRRIQFNVDNGKYKRNSTLEPTGMGYDGKWISFVRNYKRPPGNEFVKCFVNKTIYMLGDSTMRQFFYFAASEFGLDVLEEGARHFGHVPRLGRHEKLNVTVYYRFHGLPVAYSGSPSLAPYLTDVVNEIVGGRDVAIILNLGIHLISYDPVFYIHRLINIKKALECHLEKFPGTTVIVKGMNIARIPSLPFEWLVNRYNTILRKVFRDLKNSVYVHLLDMTTLWPLKLNYHPAKPLIREQAYLMFSYICDKK